MGSTMFLLMVLVLLAFTDHSQGVPEKHTESLAVSKFTDASAVGEPLTTAYPVNIPRKRIRVCHSEGKGRELVNKRCVCQPSGRCTAKHAKWKTCCQKKKNVRQWMKEEKKGSKTRKFGPSVPI